MNRYVAYACTLMVGLALSGCGTLSQAQQQSQFRAFYKQLKVEATTQGLNAHWLDEAYQGQPPAPLPHVTKAETNQPEFTDTLEAYLGRKLAPTRVVKARALLQLHQRELAKAEQTYGIPASLNVALWGLESNFGAAQGNIPLIPALVTLAYESPRQKFFRAELMNALRVVEKSHLGPTELKGSWAGAMGQNQFMPSTFLKYAVDGNADGRINIWQTEADVFASTANYLKVLGYKKGQPWRFTPLLTKQGKTYLEELELNPRGLSEPQTRAQWEKHGLRWPSKVDNAFTAQEKFRYYEPHGKGGPRYLLGPNYEAILGWNKSSYFATSVLELADIIKSSQSKKEPR